MTIKERKLLSLALMLEQISLLLITFFGGKKQLAREILFQFTANLEFCRVDAIIFWSENSFLAANGDLKAHEKVFA